MRLFETDVQKCAVVDCTDARPESSYWRGVVRGVNRPLSPEIKECNVQNVLAYWQDNEELLDKEKVDSAILNKHLSWNNLTSHRAPLAQPVSKNICQNHKLEILGLTEYGLRLEPLIRNLLTLRKGCVNCC